MKTRWRQTRRHAEHQKRILSGRWTGIPRAVQKLHRRRTAKVDRRSVFVEARIGNRFHGSTLVRNRAAARGHVERGGGEGERDERFGWRIESGFGNEGEVLGGDVAHYYLQTLVEVGRCWKGFHPALAIFVFVFKWEAHAKSNDENELAGVHCVSPEWTCACLNQSKSHTAAATAAWGVCVRHRRSDTPNGTSRWQASGELLVRYTRPQIAGRVGREKAPISRARRLVPQCPLYLSLPGSRAYTAARAPHFPPVTNIKINNKQSGFLRLSN